MRALQPGGRAGGQTIGTMSAELLVRTPEGDWQDVDLRVDASTDPIAALRRLLSLRQAHDAIPRAERAEFDAPVPLHDRRGPRADGAGIGR